MQNSEFKAAGDAAISDFMPKFRRQATDNILQTVIEMRQRGAGGGFGFAAMRHACQ